MSKTSVQVAPQPADDRSGGLELTTRRHLSDRQVQTVQRLLDAGFDELTGHGYDDLTVRRVAKRAGVTPATAYTYFESKEHLVAELYWRRYVSGPDSSTDLGAVDPGSAADRVIAVLSDFTLCVANETELSAACTVAVLANSPEVRALRERIGAELHGRLAAATAGTPSIDRLTLQTLELATAGALLQVGTGHLSYDALPQLLRDLVATVLRTKEAPR